MAAPSSFAGPRISRWQPCTQAATFHPRRVLLAGALRMTPMNNECDAARQNRIPHLLCAAGCVSAHRPQCSQPCRQQLSTPICQQQHSMMLSLQRRALQTMPHHAACGQTVTPRLILTSKSLDLRTKGRSRTSRGLMVQAQASDSDDSSPDRQPEDGPKDKSYIYRFPPLPEEYKRKNAPLLSSRHPDVMTHTTILSLLFIALMWLLF